MYKIDPSRTDLIEEFDDNPGGPYSPELTLVVNRLRLSPMEDRYIIICMRRGREWIVGRMPTERGRPVEILGDRRYDDYDDAAREVFRLRWEAVVSGDDAY